MQTMYLHDDFLDVKILYLYCFNHVPSMNYINKIDGEKPLHAIKEKFAGNDQSYTSAQMVTKEKEKNEFDWTILIVIMDNNCVLELDDNCCELLSRWKERWTLCSTDC